MHFKKLVVSTFQKYSKTNYLTRFKAHTQADIRKDKFPTPKTILSINPGVSNIPPLETLPAVGFRVSHPHQSIPNSANAKQPAKIINIETEVVSVDPSVSKKADGFWLEAAGNASTDTSSSQMLGVTLKKHDSSDGRYTKHWTCDIPIVQS